MGSPVKAVESAVGGIGSAIGNVGKDLSGVLQVAAPLAGLAFPELLPAIGTFGGLGEAGLSGGLGELLAGNSEIAQAINAGLGGTLLSSGTQLATKGSINPISAIGSGILGGLGSPGLSNALGAAMTPAFTENSNVLDFLANSPNISPEVYASAAENNTPLIDVLASSPDISPTQYAQLTQSLPDEKLYGTPFNTPTMLQKIQNAGLGILKSPADLLNQATSSIQSGDVFTPAVGKGVALEEAPVIAGKYVSSLDKLKAQQQAQNQGIQTLDNSRVDSRIAAITNAMNQAGESSKVQGVLQQEGLVDANGNPIYNTITTRSGNIPTGTAASQPSLFSMLGFKKGGSVKGRKKYAQGSQITLQDLQKMQQAMAAAQLLKKKAQLAQTIANPTIYPTQKPYSQMEQMLTAQQGIGGMGGMGNIGNMNQPKAMKKGGLMNLKGHEMDFRDGGGFVPIGKKERADDVPARLSKNEFVFTAKAVRNAGGGDIKEGAKRMYRTMKQLEAKV